MFVVVDNACLVHSGNSLGKFYATIRRLVSADWV